MSKGSLSIESVIIIILLVVTALAIIVASVPAIKEMVQNIFNLADDNVNDWQYDPTIVPVTSESPPVKTTCEGVNMAGYNTYKATIEYSVKESGLESVMPKGWDAKILMASLLQQESNFNKDVVACGSAGIAQFIVPTAKEVGLSVPTYAFVVCSKCFGGKKKTSACNPCNPSGCDKVADERFNPEKSILASASYLAKRIQAQGSVVEGVWAYNAGGDPEYVDRVIGRHYPRFLACLT